MNDSVPEMTVEPAASGPAQLGLLLRKAREARGLSIDEVTQVLKFRARQIEALEADANAVVAGDVFARGLLRSYARFLKLDPEPLLALVDTEAPLTMPEVRAPDNMGTAMPDGGWRRLPPLVLLSLLLLAVAGGLAAWHFLAPESITWNPLPSGAATAQAPAPATVEAATASVPPATPSAPEASSPSVAVTSPAPTPAADGAAPPAVPAMPAASPAPALVDGGKRLSFSFRGKSWVEVKDASQHIIFTGQYFAGSRESVSARPPVQMVVGNAAEVDVEFDGRPVDLRPYTRAEVARLTLE